MTRYFDLVIGDNATPTIPKDVAEGLAGEIRKLPPLPIAIDHGQEQEEIELTACEVKPPDDNDLPFYHLRVYAQTLRVGRERVIGEMKQRLVLGRGRDMGVVIDIELREHGPGQVLLVGECDDSMAGFVRLKIKRIKELWPTTREITPEGVERKEALTWAETAQPTESAALGDGQQGERITALLQRIYDHFVTHGEWPRYYDLEIEMHDVAPLHEIISGIDEGLLLYEWPIQESSVCFLTLKGIAKCKGSEEDIRNFLSVANLCAKRYIRDRTTFTVSNSDLVDELGMSEMEARRICELLSRGSVSFGNGTWTSGDHQRYEFRVIHGALHFEDVSSLEEYFEREARATNAQKGEAGGVRRLSQAQGTLTTEYRAKLRQNLTEHFNRDELRTLCSDLGIKHENLAADTIDGMARELVAYCERTGRVPELVEKCKGLRSKVAWEDTPE